MEYIMNILKGIVIGIANAIPGVSGGTMAVILKIYDRLVESITLNLKKLKENWLFLVTVGIGALIGILLAAKALSYLFDSYTIATQLFFMGIIVGSIPMIYKETTKIEKIKPINIIPFVVGMAAIVGLGLINSDSIAQSVETELTPVLFFKLVVFLFIAALATITPGISGALMLTVLGGYQTVLHAVNDLNIAILIPVGIGAVLGILGGARIIAFLLKRFYQGTYCAILGLVIGSLYGIFPKGISMNTQSVVGVILLIVGILIPLIPSFIKSKKVN